MILAVKFVSVVSWHNHWVQQLEDCAFMYSGKQAEKLAKSFFRDRRSSFRSI